MLVCLVARGRRPAQRERGRCFRVMRVQRMIDAQAVAATLALQPWFVLGARADQDTFAASRVYLRCRCLFPPSTPCERIGSFIRLLWDNRERMSPAAMEDKVLLAQARVLCIGHPRDECIIDAILGILEAIRRTRPHRSTGRTPHVLTEQSDWLRASGRGFEHRDEDDVPDPVDELGLRGAGVNAARVYMSARATEARPTVLPASLRCALRQVITEDTIRKLPLDVNTWRAQRRGSLRCGNGGVP